MSDGTRAVRVSRIRPALRRAAIVAFAILLPLAAHSLWDYIEVRRLVRELEAIRAKGEPVTEREAVGRNLPQPSPEHGAASYYLAGGMLALGSSPWRALVPVRNWLSESTPDPGALPELMAPVHELARNSRDALSLADRAAELPFDGFPAGTEYSYRMASIGALSELMTARTLSVSQSGDADAAVDSVIGGLQIRRALREAPYMAASGHQASAVLSLTRPSPPALVRLQTALEAEDTPDRQLRDFLRARAEYVEMIWHRYYGSDPTTPQYFTLPTRSVTETMLRPWITHKAVDLLRLWAELVDVAREDWPEKTRRSAGILAADGREQQPSWLSVGPLLSREVALAAFSQAVNATQLVADRASYVAVAIERFRRDRNVLPATLSDLVPNYLREVPVDPYSGQPLLFISTTDAYTVYSVGPNRQDDRGHISPERQRFQTGVAPNRGDDVGVRVLTPH